MGEVPMFADRAHPLDGGKVRYMACTSGYVMVRRPGCVPYVMSERAWIRLPAYDDPARKIVEGR